MERKYFSQRSGKTPDGITLDHLERIVDIVYRKFVLEGYFQYSFGYHCVDSGDNIGKESIGLNEKLILAFGGRGEKMEPTQENIHNLDRDSLFDLIEFLHDYVAKPIEPYFHAYLSCGIHVSRASFEDGQKEWRDEFNKSLMLLVSPFRLTSDGNIELLPVSEGLQNLVDNYESPSEGDDVSNRIKHACNLFLKHGSTKNEKRDALKNLADVLEFIRNDLKTYVPKKEEGELFNIANNYGIRHHKPEQKTEYDDEVYFPWFFYSYLSTIDLFTKLKSK